MWNVIYTLLLFNSAFAGGDPLPPQIPVIPFENVMEIERIDFSEIHVRRRIKNFETLERIVEHFTGVRPKLEDWSDASKSLEMDLFEKLLADFQSNYFHLPEVSREISVETILADFAWQIERLQKEIELYKGFDLDALPPRSREKYQYAIDVKTRKKAILEKIVATSNDPEKTIWFLRFYHAASRLAAHPVPWEELETNLLQELSHVSKTSIMNSALAEPEISSSTIRMSNLELIEEAVHKVFPTWTRQEVRIITQRVLTYLYFTSLMKTPEVIQQLERKADPGEWYQLVGLPVPKAGVDYRAVSTENIVSNFSSVSRFDEFDHPDDQGNTLSCMSQVVTQVMETFSRKGNRGKIGKLSARYAHARFMLAEQYPKLQPGSKINFLPSIEDKGPDFFKYMNFISNPENGLVDDFFRPWKEGEGADAKILPISGYDLTLNLYPNAEVVRRFWVKHYEIIDPSKKSDVAQFLRDSVDRGYFPIIGYNWTGAYREDWTKAAIEGDAHVGAITGYGVSYNPYAHQIEPLEPYFEIVDNKLHGETAIKISADDMQRYLAFILIIKAVDEDFVPMAQATQHYWDSFDFKK